MPTLAYAYNCCGRWLLSPCLALAPHTHNVRRADARVAAVRGSASRERASHARWIGAAMDWGCCCASTCVMLVAGPGRGAYCRDIYCRRGGRRRLSPVASRFLAFMPVGGASCHDAKPLLSETAVSLVIITSHIELDSILSPCRCGGRHLCCIYGVRSVRYGCFYLGMVDFNTDATLDAPA